MIMRSAAHSPFEQLTQYSRLWSHLVVEKFVSAYECPGAVGVITSHGCRKLRRSRTQVFLEDSAILANDEGLDAGRSVRSWKCYDRETTGHFSINNVIARAPVRVGTLRRENAEEVAMERVAIRTIVAGLREIGTDGIAVVIAAAGWREEAVMLTLAAGEVLRVFLD